MTAFTYSTPQSSSLLGANVFDTTTTQEFGLGTRTTVRYGANNDLCADFVYIKAGAALSAGQLSELPQVSGTDSYIVDAPVTSTTAAAIADAVGERFPVCVPQVDIASGSYGWAAVKGQFEVLLAANCAAWKKLYTTATAGVVDDDATPTLLVEGLQAVAAITTAAKAPCVAQHDLVLLDES